MWPRYRSVTKVPSHVTEYETYYDSVSAFVHDANGGTDFPASKRQSRKADKDWAMTASFEEAVRFALYGWDEGIRHIVGLNDRIQEKVARVVPHYGMELSETGADVDVATYLTGERACMWDWIDDAGRKPVVRVTVNAMASGWVPAQHYMTAGVMAASLIDALEQTGRRVELEVQNSISSFGGSRGKSITRVQAKLPNDALDIGAIAFAVANPSYLRRIWFSAQERLNPTQRDRFSVGHGYGVVESTPEHLRGDVHIDIGDAGQLGEERAYDWVLDRLAEQGVEIGGTR